MGDQDYVERINHSPAFHLQNHRTLWLVAGHQTWVTDDIFSWSQREIFNLSLTFTAFSNHDCAENFISHFSVALRCTVPLCWEGQCNSQQLYPKGNYSTAQSNPVCLITPTVAGIHDKIHHTLHLYRINTAAISPLPNLYAVLTL